MGGKHEERSLVQSIQGCLLGTAVGDAMGLPLENLSRRRQLRLHSKLDGYAFFMGRASGGEVEAFGAELARRLRWWLLALPAGVGFGTLRALLKLWIGFSWRRSGVFSAGNGPAMRSAHSDPKAEFGALACAFAAHRASRSSSRPSPSAFVRDLASLLPPEAGPRTFFSRRPRPELLLHDPRPRPWPPPIAAAPLKLPPLRAAGSLLHCSSIRRATERRRPRR